MLKRHELAEPTSCLNRARDDEMIWVLLDRDDAMPATLRFWAAERVRLGLNKPDDFQVAEALKVAAELEAVRR